MARETKTERKLREAREELEQVKQYGSGMESPEQRGPSRKPRRLWRSRESAMPETANCDASARKSSRAWA